MQRRGGGGGSMPNCLGEDVINDIIKRLPAKSVASAACVCRSWRNQAAKILCTPKLMSALSQNQRLEAAMDEILEKLLKKPIRPDFVIAFASQKFSLSRISSLLKKNLGSRIPIIACFAPGLIGPDAITKEQKEVKWRQPVFETSKTARRRIIAGQHGLVVTIGHFPGLHIEAVSVKLSKDTVNKETSTWLTCRKEGVLAELDGQSVLDDLDNEVGGDILMEDCTLES